MENRKGFGLVGLLIVLGIIVLLSGGVFYGYQGGFFSGGTASSTITGPIDAAKKAKDLLEQKNRETVGGVSTADWKTYKNEEYGFEFKYPKEYKDVSVSTLGNSKNESVPKKILSSSKFQVRVFDLDTFFHRNVTVPLEIRYNKEKGALVEYVNNNGALSFSKNLESVNLGVATGYLYGTGDAGSSVQYVAILDAQRNILLQFSFGGDEVELMAPWRDILTTFKFSH